MSHLFPRWYGCKRQEFQKHVALDLPDGRELVPRAWAPPFERCAPLRGLAYFGNLRVPGAEKVNYYRPSPL